MGQAQQVSYEQPPKIRTRVFGLTISWSKYKGVFGLCDLLITYQDAQDMCKLFEKNMRLPSNQRLHLQDPDKAKFFQVLKDIKELVSDGEDTLLICHYSGHGYGNGGHIGLFGADGDVNFSKEFSLLCLAAPNLWVMLVFDACTSPQPAEPRGNIDITGAVTRGALKTMTISAARLGYKAYSAWKFTKSFAEFMAQKLEANRGLFKFPEDVFAFEGPNGEHEFATTLTQKTFISIQFPVAGHNQSPPSQPVGSTIPKPLPVKPTTETTIPKPLPVPQPAASTIPKPLPVPPVFISGIIKPLPVPRPPAKKYVFTYTDNVAEYKNEQDQEHPVKSKLSWHNPLIGVSRYKVTTCFQFISLDGTRSAFKDSILKDLYDDQQWTDLIIPQGKQIRTVETLLQNSDGWLIGFKWIGDDGAVLVRVGSIDKPYLRKDPENVVTTLTLNHNQRLVGVKSWSHGQQTAWNYSFQWVICTEE